MARSSPSHVCRDKKAVPRAILRRAEPRFDEQQRVDAAAAAAAYRVADQPDDRVTVELEGGVIRASTPSASGQSRSALVALILCLAFFASSRTRSPSIRSVFAAIGRETGFGCGWYNQEKFDNGRAAKLTGAPLGIPPTASPHHRLHIHHHIHRSTRNNSFPPRDLWNFKHHEFP